jgi:hypothetical protein
VEELRRLLSEADAALSKAKEAQAQRKASLVLHDLEAKAPNDLLASLVATRNRVAGHHTPKIDKAQRKLSRLKWIRGDAPEVSAEDVKVTFGKTVSETRGDEAP